MSVEKLVAYHKALNDIDLDAVEAMFAEDAEYVSPGLNGVVVGRDKIMQAMRAYFEDYADQRAVDEQILALAPNVVRSVWRLEATSSKTGKPVFRKGREVVTFNHAGQISRVEVYDGD